MAIVQKLIEPELEPEPEPANTARSARNSRISTLLNDFVVEESISEPSDEYDEIRSCFYEVIDVSIAEVNSRLTGNNEIQHCQIRRT